MNNESELNDIKRTWQEIGRHAASSASQIPIHSLADMRSRALSIKLCYRIFVIVCLIFVPLTPVIFNQIGLPVWLSIATAIYFGLMAALCYDVYDRIKYLDLSRMTVIESLETIDSIVSKRHLYRIIGISVCVPLIAAMFYCFRIDTPMLIGGVVGGILGGVIGFMKDRNIRRQLNEIRRELIQAMAE